MKNSFLIGMLLFFGWVATYAQEVVDTKHNPQVVVAGGLWSSNSLDRWWNVRLGIETKSQSYQLGVHRLLRYAPQYSSAFANIQILPLPVGIDLWFRHYFAQKIKRWRPYFMLSLGISRSKVIENPQYYPQPKTLGAWIYFDPTVGYGIRYHVGERFSIAAEVGAGLAIAQYFPNGPPANPGYWPGSFMGALMIEKRF